MYTSPDQAPSSFGEAPRQPLTGPMTDQDPTSTTHQHGKSHHWMHLLMCAPMLLVVATCGPDVPASPPAVSWPSSCPPSAACS